MSQHTLVIYEVNLKIDNSIIEEYRTWLQTHCREIVSLEGFLFVDWYEEYERRREKPNTVLKAMKHKYSSDRCISFRYQRNPVDEGLPADPDHTYLTLLYHLKNRYVSTHHLIILLFPFSNIKKNAQEL
jgi:hypothetical protein